MLNRLRMLSMAAMLTLGVGFLMAAPQGKSANAPANQATSQSASSESAQTAKSTTKKKHTTGKHNRHKRNTSKKHFAEPTAPKQ